MRAIWTAVFVLASCSLSDAQQRWQGNYFCAEEVSGGLKWVEGLKAWDSVGFRADKKFIARFRVVGVRKHKWSWGDEDDVTDYEISITRQGSQRSDVCKYGSSAVVTVFVEDGSARCGTSTNEYRFNLRNNRFISAYLAGYYDGRDEGGNTPAVSGGKCTKIE